MTHLDTTKPSIARIYDYWLGGKDNFAADRAAAEAVRQQRPDITDLVLENKQFLTRAVTYVAQQGIRQFLDVGSGLPTSPVRAQALLAHGSSQVMVAEGDMLDPQGVLSSAALQAAGFSLDAPVCVMLGCVLHFLEYGTAHRVASGFIEALAPGSFAIVSLGRGDDEVGEDFASTYNAQHGSRVYNFTREEVAALFSGVDIVPPGIVPAPAWRPEGPQTSQAKDRKAMILAGVGRRV
ncbi:MAG: SAM-dependent methyltransferase [Streptosporangiaceae bacterium]